MNEFILPDIGEGLQDAEIVKWHVNVGDRIEVDEHLVDIETDKAVVEVPSPFTGRIVKLFGKPGDIIKVGHPLVAFESETDDPERKDSGTVVGEIQSGSRVLDESPTGIQSGNQHKTTIKAPPAVRSLARSLGVDLNKITPSGPAGTISKADVKKAATTETAAKEPVKTEIAADPEFQPLKRARRSMARNMSVSHAQVALVTLMEDADITHWSEKEDLTVRLAFAVTHACLQEPALNVFYDPEAYAIRSFNEVHLGIAVDTLDGLYVPVLKNAEKRSASGIRDQIESFKQKARSKSFQPDDLKGGTIILSNFGGIGGRYATPMVVPPMVAIVGIGRGHQELALVVNRPVSRMKLPISLSFDHRAVTGGEAARFLTAMIKNLQS